MSPPHSKPTAYVAGRLGPWVAMVAADPNYSEPMIAWGDTEEVDVDSSRVTKFKQVGGASGSSKLLLQCRRSRHVFGAVWSVVSVSQSVAGTQCSPRSAAPHMQLLKIPCNSKHRLNNDNVGRIHVSQCHKSNESLWKESISKFLSGRYVLICGYSPKFHPICGIHTHI